MNRFFLRGAIVRLRKATTSFIVSVRLSVLPRGTIRLTLKKIFHEILHVTIFRKPVEKIQLH